MDRHEPLPEREAEADIVKRLGRYLHPLMFNVSDMMAQDIADAISEITRLRAENGRLMEVLDDAEVLDALRRAAKRHEPVRPSGDFFAELKKDKLI